MRNVSLIAVKDLKLRVRDRSAFIVGIVAPLALAFIFNAVFGGSIDPGEGLGLRLGLVDEDRSEISSSLGDTLRSIEEQGVLGLNRYDDEEDAARAISAGDIAAYFAVPQGFGESISSNRATGVRVVGDVDAPTSSQIAASIADRYTTGLETARLAVATTAAIDSASLQGLDADPREAAFSFRLVEVAVATRQLDSTTFFAAGMAVFFLFFTVQFGVAGILEEDRQGTLPRLLAAPISRSTVIIGKGVLAFVIGALSMAVLVIATSSLMGADWGAPLGVAMLVVAGVLSAVGIMGVIAAVARTPEGAGNLGSIIAVVLGMLGGSFFPIGQGSDFLSNLTLFTPHAWFLRGLGDLAGGAPPTAVLPSTLAILVFALTTGALAWALLQRRMRT